MLIVNGLGAGFSTPCRSFMYHGCCRSSLVKFWGWRACPSNTSTQLKGSGVTMSTTKLKKKPVMGRGLYLVFFFLRMKNGGLYGYILPPGREGPISCLFANVQYIWITPTAVWHFFWSVPAWRLYHLCVSNHTRAANHRFSCFTKGPWMIAMFPHYHRSSSLLYRTTTYLKSEWNIWCSFHGSTLIEGPLWAPYLETCGPVGWPN